MGVLTTQAANLPGVGGGGGPPAAQVDDEFYILGRGAGVGNVEEVILPNAEHPAIIQDKVYAFATEWWGWTDGTPVGFAHGNSLYIARWDGAAWTIRGSNSAGENKTIGDGQNLALTHDRSTSGPPTIKTFYGGDPGKGFTTAYIWRARVTIYDDTDIPLLP